MNLSLFSFVRKGVDSLCQAAKQRLRGWTKPENHRPALNAVMDLTRSKPELILENMLLCQQLREAMPFGQGPRYLIRDNDNKYDASFTRVATGTGIEVLRTPHGTPKANAICERFLGSVRPECPDHFAILSERHLRRVMKEYGEYFNHARPHQGIEQRIPCEQKRGVEPLISGRIVSHPFLGGLHHDYHWQSQERPSYPRAA
jgi:hypothetical protein